MPIVLILFLMLVCTPVPWPEPVVGPSEGAAALLTAAIVGGVAARAFRMARRTRRLLREPDRRGDAVYLFQLFRSQQLFWLMGAFVIALLVCGWGWAVNRWLAVGLGGPMIPGGELALLFPFLAGWVASWFAYYLVEHDLSVVTGHVPLRLWPYLTLQFRQQLALVCLPIGLIILEQSVTRTYPAFADAWWFRAGAAVAVVGVLVAAPWLLRILLGLTPIPAGPLRQRLEAAARRLRFRYSDFLLWDTRGHAANAMVAGLVRWPRYVLFTDRLLDEMSTDEIEAVLGHEIGHVRHFHLLFYIVFLGLSLLMLVGLASALEHIAGEGSWLELAFEKLGDWQAIPLLAITAGYIFVAFGFLSRRCEREADLFGCKAVSCGQRNCCGHDAPPTTEAGLCPTGIDTFIGSLERVAVANGISRTRPGWLASWQHGTIARRVEFLEGVRNDPHVERTFRLKLLLTKAAALTALVATVAALAVTGNLGGGF